MTHAHADVLLVTVTKVETKAVLEAFLGAKHQQPPVYPIDKRVYFDLGTINGARVMLTQSEMGASGLGAAQQTVAKGIAAFSPAAVVMVGIAFGVNEKNQGMGDVLVTEHLRPYELQRVGTTKDGSVRIILRGDKPHASSWLLNLLKSAEVTWKGTKLRFGTVLTGDKLVDNVDFRDQLRLLDPEAIGGEMEGTGVYVACHDQKVDWILVKAICDWADGQKGKRKTTRQRTAAENAAAFVHHSLSFANSDWSTPVRAEDHPNKSDKIKTVQPEHLDDAGLPQHPTPPMPRAWKNHQERTALAYKALGYDVVNDFVGGDNQIAIRCTKNIPGAGRAVLHVMCHHSVAEPVHSAKVEEFIDAFHKERSPRGWTHGVIVSNRPFSSQAKETARSHDCDISLKTLEDLEADGFRFSDYVEGVTREALADPVLNQYYVPLQGSLIDAYGQRAGRRADLLSLVKDWLSDPSVQQLWILGDFGSGKTTFLRYLHAKLAREWIDGQEDRMAILVSLRHYDHATVATTFAREICHRELNVNVPFKTFEDFAKTGRLMFLFDGFDEMARASNQAQRHSLYAKLMHVSSGSKAIISCRPGYFVSAAESQEIFGNLKRLHGPGFPRIFDNHTRPRRHQTAAHSLAVDPNDKLEALVEAANSAATTAATVEVALMTDDQITEFLENHESEIKRVDETGTWNAQALTTVIRNVYDLKDLAKRPILLRLAIETVPRFLPQPDGTYEFRTEDRTIQFATITPSILYFAYTERELNREHGKSSATSSISKEARRQFFVHLARLMTERGLMSLTNTELTKEVRDFFQPTRDQVEQFTTDIRACSFLAPSGQGEQFRFVHKSFLEYFAAESFVSALNNIDTLEQRLRDDALSHEIMYFIGSHVVEFHSDAIEKLQTLARGPNNQSVLRNALNILACARVPESFLHHVKISSLNLFDLEMDKFVIEKSQISSLLLHRSCVDLLAVKESSLGTLEISDCRSQQDRSCATGSSIQVLLTSCSIAKLHINSSRAGVHAFDSTVDNLTLDQVSPERLRFQRCRVHWDSIDRGRGYPVEIVESAVSAAVLTWAGGVGDAPLVVSRSVLLGCRVRYLRGAFSSCVFIACELDGAHDPSDSKALNAMLKSMRGCTGYFYSDTGAPFSADDCPALFSEEHVSSLRKRIFSEPTDVDAIARRLAEVGKNERLALRFSNDRAGFSTLTSEEIRRRVEEAQANVTTLARILLGDGAARVRHG